MLDLDELCILHGVNVNGVFDNSAYSAQKHILYSLDELKNYVMLSICCVLIHEKSVLFSLTVNNV